jgi:hypothetical protein
MLVELFQFVENDPLLFAVNRLQDEGTIVVEEEKLTRSTSISIVVCVLYYLLLVQFRQKTSSKR